MGNKRKIIITLCSILLTISLIVCLCLNQKHYVNIDGNYLAIVVDGQSTNSFPTSGKYTVDYSCNNGQAILYQDDNDNLKWKIRVTNITGKVTCNVTFTSTNNPTTLSNYVQNLVSTTSSQTDWKVVHENGYRYEGENPNNYVWFNNELWQIIGALPVQKDGDANETNLIKLIRKEPIGTYSWDGKSSYSNDWSAATLYKMLNPVSGDTNTGAYYNGTNNNTYCYGYSNYKKNDCTFGKNGITSNNARNMIEKVVWKLGMQDTNSATADTFYQAERGTTVYSGRPTEVSNYIGLMYPSDYGYSVLANNCARTTNLSSYGNTSCSGKAWLFKSYSWTIAGDLSYSLSAFYVSDAALYISSPTNDGFSVQPVLYLKSNVYRVSGDGTVDNPYIVAM